MADHHNQEMEKGNTTEDKDQDKSTEDQADSGNQGEIIMIDASSSDDEEDTINDVRCYHAILKKVLLLKLC